MKVAEPIYDYKVEKMSSPQWVEVLVDCVYAEGLYTYKIKPNTIIKTGDIVSIPFSNSIVGGIVIKLLFQLPENLEIEKIKEIDDIITTGFFPPHYWELLQRSATYYLTDLINVVRVALPPKLLGKSQRRVRLLNQNIPDNPDNSENDCTVNQLEVINLLKQSKTGDYTYNFINQKVKNARNAIKGLVTKQWLEIYLQPPSRATPKLTKVVTFLGENEDNQLTQKQRDVLTILKNNDGELPLPELLRICELNSNSVVNTLAKKGCVVIQERETLRLLQDSSPKKDEPKILTKDQSRALEIINGLYSYSTVLLHGVTGSGKTEVYLQAIAPILQQKKSALVLVPEIGLTPQLTDRFRARFGDKVCVYHSALSDGERYDTWRQMLTGESQVVIGTRSAVFAPLPNIGIIILDEEHDTSFKQHQPVPTYHAVKIAQYRAKLVNCPLILGSATPSLESWRLATENKPLILQNTELLSSSDLEVEGQKHQHYYLSLPNRIQNRPLPPVEIVDMRQELRKGNRSIFSYSLRNGLNNLKAEGKQGILFISRRGHSTFVSCRSCGYVMECPHCDVSLSYHYTHEGATELLRCHYCNHTELHPKKCPQCFSPYLKFFGTGTQKVLLELEKEFPDLKILRFDSDTTSKKNAHRRILEAFAEGKADVLIGTQMLTKGIDLAQVTLVGVVSADGLLFHSDYKASERAFQTLTQVAGRAGRGDDAGKVIIQTYSPEHPVIQAVKNHDYLAFCKRELPERESLNYPPYGKLILLRLSGTDGDKVRQSADNIADICANLLPDHIEILGPAPANVMRVARRYRWQILLKSANNFTVEIKEKLLTLKQYCHVNVSLVIDADPLRIE
ncbi:helicase PriA essential for oriC/DnaA-independent DNA replication [Geminocystis sp. NIES-3708]|uniref:primosomal protein N' n=1 Tax=Geminocystis sp. NIES-3708 TaxID=1615909 RepID=UPI0005FC67F8|nr:primosomal protein N' [Geminocystis sp. NIES-3708]BAQ60540.1 helicase PriA essential for oriC/DnaA-independent DNA replication [Geminocystis sp. NIES-3708]